jgi:hypothetical protein
MTINTSNFGDGGLPRLAPDLTFPSAKNSDLIAKEVTGINGSAGMVTALSLTGKFVISRLNFSSVLAETVTIKLTIDSVVIWDASFTASTTGIALIGGVATSVSNPPLDFPIQCNLSLLLEIQTTTDTNVTLSYIARPIL